VSILSGFATACTEAGVDHVIGVPDSYLAPMISQISLSPTIRYIAATREEECFGIATGLVMCNKRPLLLIQNVGFMNAVGCFSTLCLTYRTPFVVIIANRGNIYDTTRYDVQKYRYFQKIVDALCVFSISWRNFRDEKDILKLCYARAASGSEPVFLLLDMPPDRI